MEKVQQNLFKPEIMQRFILLLLFGLIYNIAQSQCCGNGICEPGENATNCPYDCGAAQTWKCPNTIGSFFNDPNLPITYDTAQARGYCYAISVGPSMPTTVCFEYVYPPSGTINVNFFISDSCSVGATKVSVGTNATSCSGTATGHPAVTGFSTYNMSCTQLSGTAMLYGGGCASDSIITICVNLNTSHTCGEIYICPVIDCNSNNCGSTPPVNCPPFNFRDTSDIDICNNGINSGIAGVIPDCGTHFTYLWNDPFAQTTPIATGLSPGTYTVKVTNTAFGCDTNINVRIDSLGQPINVNATANLCQGDSILLGGSYQTSTGVYLDSLVGRYGCDSIVSTSLSILPILSSSVSANICQGDSLFVGGAYQTSAGNYTDTIQASNGCDSVITTSLSIKPIPQSSFSSNICQGDSLLFGSIYLNSSGLYTDTFLASNGCDSIISLTLNVQPNKSITANASICQGDSIFLGGAYQTNSGSYSDTLQAANGCDSVITTSLKVDNIILNSTSVTICQGDSVFLSGSYQSSPGAYADTLQAFTGCDSILTTNLSVLPVYNDSSVASICQGDSILFSNNYYSNSGLYYDTLQNSMGCDSVLVFNLSVLPQAAVSNNYSICNGDSLFLEGSYQNNSGTYYDTLQAMNGCDSIVISNLLVKPVPSISISADLCEGDSIFAQGNYQTNSGTYYDTLQTSGGCDSLIITDLTFKTTPNAAFEFGLRNSDCEGETVNLINLTTDALTYKWVINGDTLFDASPSNYFAYNKQYEILLFAYASDYCFDTAYQEVNLKGLPDVVIPNVITPNNDGMNDVFELPIPDHMKQCASIYIYNRWGQLLYEGISGNDWDGRTTAGDKVSDGVYMYVIEVGTETYKGTLTILNN